MKDFITKIMAALTVFWHDARKVINHFAIPAIGIVNGIKTVVDNPATMIITSLTPFPWDDIALTWVKKWLPKIIENLDLVANCSTSATIEEQLDCLVQYLINASPDTRDMIYHKISTLLTKFKIEEDGVGGKFSQSDLDLLLQIGYVKYKHKIDEGKDD